MTWAFGDQVLAPRAGDSYCYPGTVQQDAGEHCSILFEDGNEAWVPTGQVQPLRLEPGDWIEVRLPAGREFSIARVVRFGSGRLIVKYEDGEQETTSLGLIRMAPDQMASHLMTTSQPQTAPAPESSLSWAAGDRVWARWSGDYHWYPGTVQTVEGERIHILFDDQDQEWVAPDRVVPLTFEMGQRVFGRWQRGALFYPGRLVRVDGERINIDYDDGGKETTMISYVRLTPFALGEPLQAGQRVLAFWPPGPHFYPGTIDKMMGSSVRIHFDDGDKATFSTEQVLPLILEVGQIIFARRRGAATYTPGQIVSREGDDLQMRFGDNKTERITLAQICVLPGFRP
jgi:hypothetical protein